MLTVNVSPCATVLDEGIISIVVAADAIVLHNANTVNKMRRGLTHLIVFVAIIITL
jgi:hypothetical protein